MASDVILQWLMSGDVSIQYQAKKYLMGHDDNDLRRRISQEGWGKDFLSFRKGTGYWGYGFYQPKWISTHYTLLDLMNLEIEPDVAQISETLSMVLANNKAHDGGLKVMSSPEKSDICVNGMFLTYASYFKTGEDKLKSIVDCLLNQKMADGGFNCHSNRIGAIHSSLHTTLSVLEGFNEYRINGYQYRLGEITEAEKSGREFILEHKLFKSHRTGEIIDKKFLMLSFPSRWRYDILRCLDYFRKAEFPYDIRMEDAVSVILKKKLKDGSWPLQAKHSGLVYFDMEKPGKPSRWNTLRAIRVLMHFGIRS
jgi:hypothetical protein